jgi:hypothetical protein
MQNYSVVHVRPMADHQRVISVGRGPQAQSQGKGYIGISEKLVEVLGIRWGGMSQVGACASGRVDDSRTATENNRST